MTITLISEMASKGGKARAAKLSAKRRSEIAKLAAEASAKSRKLSAKKAASLK